MELTGNNSQQRKCHEQHCLRHSISMPAAWMWAQHVQLTGGKRQAVALVGLWGRRTACRRILVQPIGACLQA